MNEAPLSLYGTAGLSPDRQSGTNVLLRDRDPTW